MTFPGKWLGRLLMPLPISISDSILSVSNFTKNELSTALGVNLEKIIVTPLAPTSAPTKTNVILLNRLYLQPFFLFVGTLEPRKTYKIS
jgi:hypothetical protein